MREMDNSHHDHYNAVYSQDFGGLEPGPGHGWIQWKGTKVCMDVYCACGHSGHVDADFFYYYRCPQCARLFAVGCNVKLIALDEEQSAHVERERDLCIRSDDAEPSWEV